jgi:tetraacyldisaccharide 4'-kinase
MKGAGVGSRLWTYPLWPLGVCFLGAARLKALWFDGFASPVDLGKPAVSVGNLTFGGTGKTPFTVALARMLQGMGHRPAVLLRGYGRSSAGARLVGPESAFEEVGEEALLLARNLPGIRVAVGELREEAAALARDGCDIFLLDDAFQHLRVRRDVDLLLVDATRPGDLHAPPVGRLREPLSAARRASAVMVTRGAPQGLPPAMGPFVPGIPLLGVRFQWDPAPGGEGGFSCWNDLKGLPLLAFAGVGNPGAFFGQARELGLSLASEVAFPDHARPNSARLELLAGESRRAGAAAVLTTEKDAVKWAPLWTAPQPLVFPRLTATLEGDLESFQSMLDRVFLPGQTR